MSESGTGAERALGDHTRKHGKPTSWLLASVVFAAYIAGGAAVIAELSWLFWLSAGVVLVSIPAGRFVRIAREPPHAR